jgi:thiopurine S-methyltransferase
MSSKKSIVLNDDMDSWKSRWNSGNIGFHLPTTHHALSKFLFHLLDDSISHPSFPKRILIPLCGKTVDMLFLQAHGHKVSFQKFTLS